MNAARIPSSACALAVAIIALAVVWAAPSPAAQVTLAWDPSEDPAVIGYRIYAGPIEGDFDTIVDAGNVTVYTVDGLQPGQTYRFAATAYDAEGNESAFSNQVEYLVPVDVDADDTPPATPVIASTVGDQTVNQDTCRQFTVSGTAEAQSTVEVFAGRISLGTAAADAAGVWRLTADLTATTVPEGTLELTATATDAAGNTSGASEPVETPFDKTAPTVVAIGSSAGDGRYGAGAAIEVIVAFSEPVTLSGGRLLIELNSGGSVAISSFESSDTAAGMYTVAAGHQSDGLDARSMALDDGAELRDAAGNPALVALPDETIPATVAIAVDAVAPAAPTILFPEPNRFVNRNDHRHFTVTGKTEPEAVVAVSTNDTLLGLAAADETGDWRLAIDLEAAGMAEGPLPLTATAADAAGNIGPASTAVTIHYDKTPPVIAAVTSATPDGRYGSGDEIDVTVVFSEPVVLSGGYLLVELNSGGRVAIAPFGPSTASSGVYTVSAGEAAAALDATAVLLNGDALQDRAGNPAEVHLPSTLLAGTRAIAVDATPAPAAFDEPQGPSGEFPVSGDPSDDRRSDEEPSATRRVLELAEFHLDRQWQELLFARDVDRPVVIASATAPGQPAGAAVQLMTDPWGRFHARLQPVDGRGAPADGTGWVQFLVCDQGRFTLDGGAELEAGRQRAGGNDEVIDIAFSRSFEAPPVVVASAAAKSGDAPIGLTLTEITRHGCRIHVNTRHGDSEVHYLAIDTAAGTIAGELAFEADGFDAETTEPAAPTADTAEPALIPMTLASGIVIYYPADRSTPAPRPARHEIVFQRGFDSAPALFCTLPGSAPTGSPAPTWGIPDAFGARLDLPAGTGRHVAWRQGYLAVAETGSGLDSDWDGISDRDEILVYGTDPDTADTDGDGIDDGTELAIFGRHWDRQPDHDGLSNLLDVDSDDDGIRDDVDNCLLTTNPRQVDSDGDEYGNACDCDLNNDGVVDEADVALVHAAADAEPGELLWDPSVADFNADGGVDAADIDAMQSRLGTEEPFL